ncbi:integral membrane protein [Fusarium sp. NRRL 52700]|nr:integral membrane protein [Fusarium sp. NRRL 52700]
MTGRLPNVWAAIIIPVPASALALVLRIKARRMTKMGVGYDDALSIAAWFVALGYAILLIVWTTRYYMGRKIGHFPEDKIDHILEKSHEILFASEILYSWSIFLSKMSVLTFYRRIFQFSSIRVPIIILMVCCGCWITIRTFMTIFHCMPVQAYWDKSVDGKCMNNIGQYYLGTDLTHCLMDFIILALPLFEVARMKLILGQKIAVIGIFSLGSLVGIASIFQIVEAQKYASNSREFPYDFSLAMIWANVEVHLAVFTSCLALLRPIFRKFIPGLSSGNTTYPANGLSHASNTYTNSVALRRSRSPRDVEEVIEGQRAYAYLDYDAISLPGLKDINSISRLQEREQHPPSMTESGGRGSLSSQNSVR